MVTLPFHIPHFPHLGRFSDPSHDYDDVVDELVRLAALPPASLSSGDLYYLFNSFLPAGSFEEMAPYVPHALSLLVDHDGRRYETTETDSTPDELLESLICWCYVEAAELRCRPDFLAGMQEAFMLLFTHWTSNLALFESGRLAQQALRNAGLIDSLLGEGERLIHYHKLTIFPWLHPGHYLPHILALDTVPHAAWTLWVSDPDNSIEHKPVPLPTATRRRAVEMVEEWLLSPAASPADLAVWDPVLTRHREQLSLFPDAS